MGFCFLILFIMKKSIPLKEIVGFLPYELKLLITAENEDRKGEQVKMTGIDFTMGKIIYSTDNSSFYEYELTPIVRPFSDLTKEITHNGKTFVPIVEIAKIADSVKKVIRMNHKQTITGFDYLNGSGEIMRFCYHHITNHFQITYVNEEEFRNECVLNQIEMFNKMHELKFDIYDWIKDGLSVDLNTL